MDYRISLRMELMEKRNHTHRSVKTDAASLDHLRIRVYRGIYGEWNAGSPTYRDLRMLGPACFAPSDRFSG